MRFTVTLLFVVLSVFAANATFISVESAPVISLSQVSGPIGLSISVSGAGFLPTDTTCSLSSPSSSSVIASAACVVANGLLTGGFTVGNVILGTYVIQVSGNQGDSAQALLEVDGGPQIGISPAVGPAGSDVSIHGNGFMPSDNTCTLSSPSSPGVILAGTAACVIQSGLPIGGFIIGNVPSGEYLIRVTGSQGDSAQAIMTVIG